MNLMRRFFYARRSLALTCAVVLFSLHSAAQAGDEDLRAEVKSLLERVRVLEAEVETLKSSRPLPHQLRHLQLLQSLLLLSRRRPRPRQRPVRSCRFMAEPAPQLKRSIPTLVSSEILLAPRDKIESIRYPRLRFKKARSRCSRLLIRTHGPTSF